MITLVTSKKLIVGLEIGTTKVVVLIAELNTKGAINIIGFGNCTSYGISKGEIIDLNSIIQCVQSAIHQAEKMAKCQISSVYLAISGQHINCQNEIGMLPISKKVVTYEDIENVIYIAKSVKIKEEHTILHIIPQEYSIDYQSGIKNPIGLSGIRMQAKVHIITCHNDTIKNITRAMKLCGIKINQIVFSGLASSYSVLTNEEKDLGVCVVDMGGGTMDIITFNSGFISFSKTIPYAGNIITKDISYAFTTSFFDAEEIKINYGYIFQPNLKDKINCFEIPIIGENSYKNINYQELYEIIEPRYFELLNLVNLEILNFQNKLKLNNKSISGIVLTGGSSKILGLSKYAKKIFRLKVRIGEPQNIVHGCLKDIKGPAYSTVIGLLLYGKEVYFKNQNLFFKKKISWINRVNNWIKNNLI